MRILGSPSTPRPARALAHVFAIVFLFGGVPATAQIPEITWQAEETVDSGVADVSENPGASVLFHDGLWQVVYIKDGNVMHAWRDAGGWQSEALTALQPPVEARAPGLAATDGFLHVVWEDNQEVLPQVRTRRHDGSIWSAEECLSCAGNLGRSPAVSGRSDRALAVWEDEPTLATPAIAGARFENGSWSAQEPISLSPGVARQPAVAADPTIGPVYVVWSDTRHGDPELYLRTLDSWFGPSGWSAEVRLTDLAGSNARPSIHTETSLSDAIGDRFHVAFENDFSGDDLVWAGCYEGGAPISAERVARLPSVASDRPNLTGFRFSNLECELSFGSDRHVTLLAYSERPLSTAVHQLAHTELCPTASDDVESTIGAVNTGMAVGAVEGDPDAGVLYLYVRGTMDLVARAGTLLGVCKDVITAAPPAFLIAPEGTPSNTVTASNTCSGLMQGAVLQLNIDPQTGLVFDPEDPQPEFEVTDENGEATFSVRGGGCCESCTASIVCPEHEWAGVRSPDINGDCRVDQADIEYIQSVFGTSDFCGDLNGDGFVTLADLNTVQGTFGHHCSHVSAVAPGASAPPPIGMTVLPNPAPGRATIRLALARPGVTRVRVVDINGRVRRDLGIVEGAAATLVWDGRDDSGREVATGRYFVVARATEGELRRSILMLR